MLKRGSYLYAYPELLPKPSPEDPPFPGDLVFSQEHEGQYIYLSGSPLDYPNQTLIGAWNADGSILLDEHGVPIPIDPLWEELRPYGNTPEGEATDALPFHYWQGHAPVRQVQEPEAVVVNTLAQYPPLVQPIILTMARRWDDTLGFEGWGWVATIEFPDPNRPPDARAIGVYDDQWGYLYTTGAFVWTEVEPAEGEEPAVYKWQTVSPPGRATAEKEAVYYALLLGSTQEGRMVLEATQDSQQNFFWEGNQPPPPGGGQWVDSGATVTGSAGAVTLVSDKTLLPVGSLVRIEGQEATVTDWWAGGDGVILDPYRVYTNGATIEIWQ